jgi:hypothetical protein
MTSTLWDVTVWIPVVRVFAALLGRCVGDDDLVRAVSAS